MNCQPHKNFFITEKDSISLLKKLLKKSGSQVGLSTYQLAKMDIIISEIVSNFFKHTATRGEILFNEIVQNGNPGIEIISIDHGPGMQNASQMMKDGVSTTKTLGTGLGAIKRLSDQFDIYSVKGWGTLLLSRIFKNPFSTTKPDKALEFSTLMIAYPEEIYCGDSLSYKVTGEKYAFLLTDGLGHGKMAYDASQQATEVFQATPSVDPCQTLKTIHESIAHTRGAVGMALALNTLQQTIDYCGIGNISLHMITYEKASHGISTNGILGHNIHNTLLRTQLSWKDPAFLILHSDGLKSRWEIKEYPGLMHKDLSLIAAALYKDHKRRKDDCAILVIKLKAAP